MNKFDQFYESILKEEKKYEGGFDLTYISDKNWKKVLDLIGASYKPKRDKTPLGSPIWMWKGDNVNISTVNDPISGKYSADGPPKGRKDEKGFASYIEIEGDSEKIVKDVVKLIRKTADSIHR